MVKIFFDDEGYLIRLSEIDSFEEYVRMSNQIIYTRGIAILNYLQSRYTNNNNLSVQQFNDEPQLSSKPTSEELAYEALKIAEEEVDKIFKLDEHFNQKNSNLSQLKLEFTKKKIYGGFVILLLIIFLIFSNSEILFFAWILSIILYLSDKVRIFKEKIKYNKLIRENQKEHTEEKKKLLSTLRKEYFSIPTEFRKHNHISRIRYYLNANIASNLEQAIHYYSNEYNTKMMEEQIYNLHHSNKILQDRVTELELEKERRELDRY